MSTRINRKHFDDATVLVNRQDGRPVGSRIESVMGTFVTDHWPSKIKNVRVESKLGLLVVETKKGETRFFGKEEALTESSAGGSMGGHDPRAQGQMRFIIRAFGKWADGRHEVCVKRIRTEHPELAKGKNVNALCAWLKDQWAGTTKWRGRSSDPKQKAEDAAIQAKARGSAYARFTHSMPMELDALGLQTLVEDVMELTGISPEDVFVELGGDLADLEAEGVPEADRDDIFESLWALEVELSASALVEVERDLRRFIAAPQSAIGDPNVLIEEWLALNGAPSTVDEDPATVIECARRIARGSFEDAHSEAENRIAEAAAGVQRVLMAPTAVEVFSMGAEPTARELTLTESSATAMPVDDLAEAITSTESTDGLLNRARTLLEMRGLNTPERREALRHATRSQLVRTVALLDTPIVESADAVLTHLAPREFVVTAEAEARLEEAGAYKVSGYTTKSGKKVSTYWRGNGPHKGITGATKAEVLQKIAAKTSSPQVAKTPPTSGSTLQRERKKKATAAKPKGGDAKLVTTAIDHLFDKNVSEGRKHQHLKAIAKVPSGVLEGMERPDLVDLANKADELGHSGVAKRVDAIVANMDKGKKSAKPKPAAAKAAPATKAAPAAAATGAFDGYGLGSENLKVGDVRAVSEDEAAEYIQKKLYSALNSGDWERFGWQKREAAAKRNQAKLEDEFGADFVKKWLDAGAADERARKDKRSVAVKAARDAMYDEVAAKHGVTADAIRAEEMNPSKGRTVYGNDLRGYDRSTPEEIAQHEKPGVAHVAKWLADNKKKPTKADYAKRPAKIDSPLRGPGGNVRNFRSMSDQKLVDVARAEGTRMGPPDEAGLEALKAELRARGIRASYSSSKPQKIKGR